jgi:hypothetical protein
MIDLIIQYIVSISVLQNKLKKAALHVIAQQMPDEEIENLKKVKIARRLSLKTIEGFYMRTYLKSLRLNTLRQLLDSQSTGKYFIYERHFITTY